MTRHEAIEAALDAAASFVPLRVAFARLYDEAYKAGDLDRQRMERAVIKPKRPPRRERPEHVRRAARRAGGNAKP